jgi:hypothetical protein
MICLGVVVTFRPRPTHRAKQVPDPKDDAFRIHIVLIKDGHSTEPPTRELPGTTFGLPELAARISDAIAGTADC